MRIDSKVTMAGVPILKVRNGLRHFRPLDIITTEGICRCVGLSLQKTEELVVELVQGSYLVRQERDYEGKPVWGFTVKGNAFLMATGAAPITRKTADRLINDLLRRAQTVNASPKYLIKVTEVVVFGSYLGTASRINDVDVFLKLEWKESDPRKREELCDRHADEAERRGREFRLFIDRMAWPWTQVRLYLKNRSSALSLHSEEQDREILANTPVRVLYKVDE